MFDLAICPSPSPVRLKVRRHCAGCGKVLFGRGFAKCFDCREAEAAERLAGRRLCVECGDPAKGKSWRCEPCKHDHELMRHWHRQIKYRKANHARVRELNNAAAKRWRENNTGAEAARQKRKYHNNLEHYRARERKKYSKKMAKNPEKERARWRKSWLRRKTKKAVGAAA